MKPSSTRGRTTWPRSAATASTFSACTPRQRPGAPFDRDTLLTVVTLYWVTGSIGTSFRQYFDWDHNPPRPAITVPAAFTLSIEPSMANFPREIAERSCTDIRHWSEPGRGGHFMPLEEPALLATQMREFFRQCGSARETPR